CRESDDQADLRIRGHRPQHTRSSVRCSCGTPYLAEIAPPALIVLRVTCPVRGDSQARASSIGHHQVYAWPNQAVILHQRHRRRTVAPSTQGFAELEAVCASRLGNRVSTAT